MTGQQHIHPAALFGHQPTPPGGSSLWAANYGEELRKLFVRQAHREPRSVQRAPGPSEMAVECDRQLVSKMAGIPETWHGLDPWASIVGLALDAWLKRYFDNENLLHDPTGQFKRWLTDLRVAAHPRYPGTMDVYDAVTFTACDMKAQGPTTSARLRSPAGPGPRYLGQLLLYSRGLRLAGYRVDRIAIISLPRTKSSLAEMYVWEKFLTPADDEETDRILLRAEVRRQAAQMVLSGQIPIEQIKRTPGYDCGFCSWYRPESAKDGGKGCPGHSAPADWPQRPAA